jgi:lipoate-protein ligase A
MGDPFNSLRLLPLEVNPGTLAMALDEVLLENASSGQPALRFYQWSKPTVSLGYFQPFAVASIFEGMDMVRRPTGGDLLIHHHELTYALALPDAWLPSRPEELACLVHRVIAGVLASMGVPTACQPSKGKLQVPDAPEGILCFLHPAAGDVLAGGFKVVGSAQRRRQEALLQHGSILLKASEWAPWLKGVSDVAQANLTAMQLADSLRLEIPKALGMAVTHSVWNENERTRALQIAGNRYSSPVWNQRR